MPNDLIIIISDPFMGGEDYLNRPNSDRFETSLAGDTSLVALAQSYPGHWEDPPKRSWEELKPIVAEEIRRHPALMVWVAAHMSCFEGYLDKSEIKLQIRCKEAERDLYLELSGLSDKPKLAVYGFHHEIAAPIWSVLWSWESRDSPTFGRDLVNAIRGADSETLFDQVSVVRHRILGLFLPLDIALQNWTESQDRQLREQVDSRLARKIQEALNLLDHASLNAQEAREVRGNIDLGQLRAHLNLETACDAARQAESFHAWINRLDQMLDDVRKALVS